MWLLSATKRLMLLMAILLFSGCRPSASVELIQLQYRGPEERLSLASNEVHWAPDGGVERYLAEFPLPGAVTGKPAYLLYLRVASPASSPGSDDCPVRGFIIQTRGEHAGLETVVGGEISIEGTSLAGRAMRRLEFDLQCEQGTRIRGTLGARRDDGYLLAF